MVSMSRLESVLGKPTVSFLPFIVLPCYSCLIDYVSASAIPLQEAFVFNTAVSSSFLVSCFILFVDSRVIVGHYYVFNIWCARVAYFHGIHQKTEKH